MNVLLSFDDYTKLIENYNNIKKDLELKKSILEQNHSRLLELCGQPTRPRLPNGSNFLQQEPTKKPVWQQFPPFGLAQLATLQMNSVLIQSLLVFSLSPLSLIQYLPCILLSDFFSCLLSLSLSLSVVISSTIYPT